MAHPALADLIARFGREEAAVVDMLPPLLAEFPALPRLPPPPPADGGDADAASAISARNAAVDALLSRGVDIYACHSCKRPYFGGLHDCRQGGVEEEMAWRPEEHACAACVARVTGASCAKHGDAELQWKCRFCCSPAVWFCFG